MSLYPEKTEQSMIRPLANLAMKLRPLSNMPMELSGLDRAAAEGRLTHVQWAEGLCFLEDRGDYKSLKLMFSRELGDFPDIVSEKPLAFDYPFKADRNVSDITAVFLAAGYRLFETRMRVQVRRDKVLYTGTDARVSFAGPEDAERIDSLLRMAYPKYVSCFPLMNELKELAEAHQIYAIYDQQLPQAECCIGFMHFEEHKSYRELRHLVTHPDYLGQGLARTLMGHSTMEASQPLVKLWVAEDNARALNIYYKMGYEADGARSLVFLKEN